MVTYAQLRNMDFSRLSEAATAAGGLSGNLSSRGSEVSSAADIPAGMWAGADASAAGSLMSPLSSPLYDASDAFRHTQGVLETLVESLTVAKSRLDDAHNLAAGTGIVINADGSLTPPPTDNQLDHQRNLERLRQIKQLIDEALELADEADGLAAVEIENQRPLKDLLPPPENMEMPLLIAGPWVDQNFFPGASRYVPGAYQFLYDNADYVDVWGGGNATLDGDGLNLNGNVGGGWKEGVKFGENGEYGSLTGMIGAEADGKLQVGPNGLNVGAGGFAGGNITYQTPGIDAGPGDTEFSASVTPRYGVGAEANLGMTYSDGQFNFKPKAGIAWGPGISVGAEVNIDVPATIDSIGEAANSVRKVIPGL